MLSHIVIKSVDERTFTGYISVEIVDRQNDIVPTSCLDEAMGPYLERGGQLQLIHSNIPVGKLSHHFITIDPETLKPAVAVFGKIFKGGTVYDKVWQEFLKEDSSVTFSIGGYPLKYHDVIVKGKSVRSLDKIELYEVSVICDIDEKKAEPANPRATLLGLGHIAQLPIPITVKMVLDYMGKEKEEEEVTKTDNDEEEVEKSEDEEESSDTSEDNMKKSIAEEVARDAQNMMGGQAAIKLINDANAQVITLTSTINKQARVIEDLKKDNERKNADILSLTKEKEKAILKADAWRDIFKKNSATEDVLSEMITRGKTVINEGGTPPSQGRAVPVMKNFEKNEADVKLVEDFKKGKNTNVSDEEFLKVVRAAEGF